MTILIDTTATTTQTIVTDELRIVTQDAVIAVDGVGVVGIQLINGSTSGQGRLVVAGLVSSDGSIAILCDGNDHVTVTQTGQVFGFGADGVGISFGATADAAGSICQIAGMVYGDRFGIVMTVGSSEEPTELTISSTGVVQGGVGIGGTTGFTAAIIVGGVAEAPGQSTIINHGLIHAEANQLDGARTAIGNGGLGFGLRDFDDVAENVLILENTGTIFGDILALAGHDTIYNSGLINGTIFAGSGEDAVLNSGLIDGDVFLGIGGDFFVGRDGRVSGGVYGDDGNDVIIGGSSNDTLYGGDDDDLLFGLDGSDFLGGDQGEDELLGGGGDDTIEGGSNADTIFGGSGDDSIAGDSGTDLIFGDSGDDSIFGGTSQDTIFGGSGDDTIDGGSSNDEISGGSGDDLLRGDSGSDSIGGGAGNDAMAGGSGDDSMDGGSGDDRMFGGSDNDTLEGTLGDDYLDGGSGDDSMSGGSDNDTLVGGAGQDTMSGGWGADVFDFNAISESATGSATRDSITDFETGVDMIDLSDISPSLTFVNTFSGTAGEVRYNETVGRLYIDIDGDGASDFQVDFGAGTVLAETDLIL